MQYHADSPLLLKAPIFFISPDDRIIEAKVLNYRKAKDQFIIIIENCNDRDKAENFRNYEICIAPHIMHDFLRAHTKSSQQIKKANKEEDIFVYQLAGLSAYVVDENTKENKYLGILEKVDFIAGQEIWFIYTEGASGADGKSGANGADGKNKASERKEILFPAVPDFVQEINLKEKKVFLTPPEGLIEIYTE